MQGLGVWFIISLIGSWILSLIPEKEPKQEVVAEETVAKNAWLGDHIVPAGKIAYCYFCKKYLQSAEQVTTHAKGKKHTNLAQDTIRWYRFLDRAEYEASKIKRK